MVGVHSSAGDKIRFSSIYYDHRTDEGLKESLVYVDDVPFQLKKHKDMRQLSLGMTGVYEHELPASSLETFADEDRTSEDNHCHYYHFLFRTGHTSTVFRIPEKVRKGSPPD